MEPITPSTSEIVLDRLEDIVIMSHYIQAFLTEKPRYDAKPKDVAGFLVDKGFLNPIDEPEKYLREIFRVLQENQFLYLVPQVKNISGKPADWILNPLDLI